MRQSFLIVVLSSTIVLLIVSILLDFNIFSNIESQSLNKPHNKISHFLDSTPLANEVYAVSPINVTLNFNFDLTSDSSLSAKSTDGIEWTEGNILIEDANTVLKIKLKQVMPEGKYNVSYTACFVSNICESGQFPFSIDSAKKSEYLDLRNKKQVEIKMKDLKFGPQKIMISPDTEVVWINDEKVSHYINTETHPEHTYYPSQNSKELKIGETFLTVFELPGQYNYHCSAHVPEGMLGSIIVEN